MITRGEGRPPRLQIEIGVLRRVDVVVAFQTVHFQDGPDVGLEIDHLGHLHGGNLAARAEMQDADGQQDAEEKS